jgi:hypothetical protein
MANYDDHSCRWVEVSMGWTDKPIFKNPRMPAERGRIFSYGSHFEIARLLRDSKDQPSLFLINGDRFSNTTSKHQAAVRGAITRRAGHVPQVTIPFSALDAANIIHSTVQIVESTSDWWEERSEDRTEFPAEAKWEYEERTADRGGWQNSLTGEFKPRPEGSHYGGMPRRDTCDECVTEPRLAWNPDDRDKAYRDYAQAKRDHEAHVRFRHGEWEEVRHQIRNTGRKVVRNRRGWVEWEIIDDPDAPLGYVFTRTWQRHWLGASLIRAQVQYRGRAKCRPCQGTGVVEPYSEQFADDVGYGPLTRRQDEYAYSQGVYVQRLETNDYIGRHRTVAATRMVTRCPDCGGSRWVRRTRQRWAYFLSAFDENEARPSYFFCELPPKVRPTTVAEAFETLKPQAVKLAEELGREVQRQGDIYWIPMPDLDLRSLKEQGGRHIRRKVVLEPRMHWLDGVDPSVLSTNHTATEQVRVGRLTYARGTLRHEPSGRRPDHARIRLGDGKTWGLVVKNTVPIGG